METRKIGSLEVSLVGLGCNNFGKRLNAEGTAEVVHAAIDSGINFFDTADVYGGTLSEEYLGRALGPKRKSIIIATKFGHKVDEQHQGAKPEYVRQAVEDSLRRLGTDYIDLYQLHRPDTETPIAETLQALDGLVQAGKVREIGVSNFSAQQLREAAGAVGDGEARVVSVQNEYSLLHRDPEAEVLPEAECEGLGFLPYFPLASGLLTGKYQLGKPLPTDTRIQPGGRFGDLLAEEKLALVGTFQQFAERQGHTLLELAFSWLIRHPTVASVIAGATSPVQIAANAQAADWKLTDVELAEVDRISDVMRGG